MLLPWQEIPAVPLPLLGQLLRFAAAVSLFAGIVVMAGRSEHPLMAMSPGPLVTFVSVTVPAAAGLVAAYALYRPWRALLLVVALTPFWNSAYVSWQYGSIQVILQTAFVLALAVGAVTTRSRSGAFLWSAADLLAASRTKGFAAFRLAEVAVAGLVGIAVLSTLASHNVAVSSPVLMHGILEPIALGALVVFLRPTRRELVALVVALGVSVGLGTLLNVIEILPTTTSFAALQAQRLYFARASFYNSGLFAAVVATTIPLVVAVVVWRRSLALPRWAYALLTAALIASLAGLFFSLSKSAWIATAIGTMLVILLMLTSWRRRIALLIAGVAVSTLFIPWPALVLQVAPNLNTAYRNVMVTLVGESRFDSWNPATLAGRGSLTERYYAVDAAVQMALNNPVLGVGLNQFGVNYSSPTYRPPAARDSLDHAHSFFPEIAAELGLFAAALAAVIYAASAWSLWRIYRRAQDQLTRLLAAGLLAAITAWLVVATAYGCNFYRVTIDLSSDVVTSALVVGAAIALSSAVHAEKPWRRSGLLRQAGPYRIAGD